MSASRAAAAARLHQVPVPTRLSRLGMSAGLEFEADIDRAIECVLRSRATPFEVRDFSSYGYDERQYCSPGFDLPVGSFRRTPHGEYTEYHTSADNLDFVSEEHLAGSLGALLETIDLLESDVAFRNLSPNCEPQLGRRGLLPAACERAQRRGGERGEDGAPVDAQSVRRHQQPSRYCRALAASSASFVAPRKSWSSTVCWKNARSGVNRTAVTPRRLQFTLAGVSMPMRSTSPDQLGHRLHAQLSHGIGAMHLHGHFADPKIGGDLLVQIRRWRRGPPHRARAG